MGEKPLPSAEDVWWTWAVTATRDDLPAGVSVTFDECDYVLGIDHDEARLRMQRLRGGRAVLWGRVSFPVVEDPHLLDGVPDWVGSEAVRHPRDDSVPEFLAWFARGEWDSNALDWWRSSRDLFDVLRSTHRGTVRQARAGELDHPLLVAARGAAPINLQLGVRRRVARQVYDQMRDTHEHDRGLPGQPMALVNWARVTRPRLFSDVVRVQQGVVELPRPSRRLTGDEATRLLAVLQQLHAEDAADDSGAWLVARVRYDGHTISLERAYDSLPAWYDADPPDLAALAWEMKQRTPRWRPPWVRLLPQQV